MLHTGPLYKYTYTVVPNGNRTRESNPQIANLYPYPLSLSTSAEFLVAFCLLSSFYQCRILGCLLSPVLFLPVQVSWLPFVSYPLSTSAGFLVDCRILGCRLSLILFLPVQDSWLPVVSNPLSTIAGFWVACCLQSSFYQCRILGNLLSSFSFYQCRILGGLLSSFSFYQCWITAIL